MTTDSDLLALGALVLAIAMGALAIGAVLAMGALSSFGGSTIKIDVPSSC